MPRSCSCCRICKGLSFQLSEIAAQVQHYQDRLEHNPQRLNDVEERLELINGLKRKYGDTIAEVLATEQRAVKELRRDFATVRSASKPWKRNVRRCCTVWANWARRFPRRARKRRPIFLPQWNENCGICIWRERGSQSVLIASLPRKGPIPQTAVFAFDRSGLDRAEFVISANPGEPLKPMARVASGGETARLMLALKSALAAVDATPTLIFDEIDQGIGGRVGDIVGRKLWGLAAVGGPPGHHRHPPAAAGRLWRRPPACEQRGCRGADNDPGPAAGARWPR